MNAKRRAQSGFNLLEVLVALAVLSIGLLAVAGLQIQGVRFNHQSYSRSQAVMVANDYIERMYANHPAVRLGRYGAFRSDKLDCNVPPATLCASQSDQPDPDKCDPPEMAEYDQFILGCGYPVDAARYGGVTDLLPSGSIVVDCLNADDTVADPCPVGARHRIQVIWQEVVPEEGGGFSDPVPVTLTQVVQP